MPKTSIVILTYNQLDYTKECIESVRRFTSDYEIIVVDNASSDETVSWLQDQKDIITIFNGDNKGFAGGCNQGIGKASGEVVVLLNNDTIVTPRWLDNLLICLNSSEKTGAAGTATNHDVTSQFIFEPGKIDEMISFADKFNKSNPKLWKEEIRLVGFCLAIKKSVIQEIGLLDERFFPGNFEDDDYCIRMCLAGYKLFFCGDTFVHHYGSVSFNTTLNSALAVNRQRFLEKWSFVPKANGSILLSMLPEDGALAKVRVLEAGCGYGRTILKIKERFAQGEFFGIEANSIAAHIARRFAAVKTGDLEKLELDYPEHYFDYILLSDILEHLVDPWGFLIKIRHYLKPDGYLLTSIPNVMHFSVISQLLAGEWNYVDAGILDRTHLRFFTLATSKRMFQECGYAVTEIRELTPAYKQVEGLLEYLHQMTHSERRRELLVEQYLIKAQRASASHL